MKRMSRALIVAVLLFAVSGDAATIKKKDGQIVEGTIISRMIVLKRLEQSPSKDNPANMVYSVTYWLLPGKDIQVIDEDGVHMTKDRDPAVAVILLVASQTGTPPDEGVVLVEGLAFRGGEKVNFQKQWEKPDMFLARRVAPLNLNPDHVFTDPLAGPVNGTPTTYWIDPGIRVKTKQGEINIPVSEIVDFKQKTEKTEK